MAISIGINGLGCLGRRLFRLAYQDKEFNVKAVSDNSPPEAVAYVLNFDTIYSRFPEKITYQEGNLITKSARIPLIQESEPGKIPWEDLGVDVVIDATEKYRTTAELEGHLNRGAKHVILTTPPADEESIPFFIRGINDDKISGDLRILSSGSAATHCLLPLLRILDQNFEIENASLTIVRSFTTEQQLLDSPVESMRLSRAAAQNIIPSKTWCVKSAKALLPNLEGRLHGMTMEVPVSDGSVIDLVTSVKKNTTPEEINRVVMKSAENEYDGLVEYCRDPIVSTDVINSRRSCIFDSLSTDVLEGNMIKTLSWYDNFWSYSLRILELVKKTASGSIK